MNEEKQWKKSRENIRRIDQFLFHRGPKKRGNYFNSLWSRDSPLMPTESPGAMNKKLVGFPAISRHSCVLSWQANPGCARNFENQKEEDEREPGPTLRKVDWVRSFIAVNCKTPIVYSSRRFCHSSSSNLVPFFVKPFLANYGYSYKGNSEVMEWGSDEEGTKQPVGFVDQRDKETRKIWGIGNGTKVCPIYQVLWQCRRLWCVKKTLNIWKSSRTNCLSTPSSKKYKWKLSSLYSRL